MSLTNGVITAIPAPEDYVVDFANPARQGNIACYWISGIGMVLALLFMCQRLYVKIIVRRSFGIDDACLFVAWIFTVAIQALIIRGFVLKYIGVHAFEIPISQFADFVKYSVYLNAIVYAPPTALAKLVILIFYNGLQNQQKWFQWSVWLVMFINVGSNVGIFFSSIFACKPIAMGWDINIIDGVCIDRVAMFEATAILAVIVDVMIILLPVPMVLGLQMSRSKKAGLLFIFTIGSATVITSIVRLVLLITKLTDIDQPWGGGPISVWICVEANLLIMCASLPTLRLFVRTVAPGLISSTANTSQNKYNSSGPYGGRSGRSAIIGGSIPGPGTNPKRNKYGRFDEEGDREYGMETFVQGQDSHIGANSNKGSAGWSNDGSSDTAIIQTTTTDIVYTSQKAQGL